MSSRASTEVAPGGLSRFFGSRSSIDAAGLEERCENRVVHVALRIEIAEADHVAGPAGKLLEPRQGARGPVRKTARLQGRNSE